MKMIYCKTFAVMHTLPKYRRANLGTKLSISDKSPLRFLLCDRSNVRSAGTPTNTLGGSNVSYDTTNHLLIIYSLNYFI